MLARVAVILSIWLAGFGMAQAQVAESDSMIFTPSKYLLLDKGLQFRITKAINSMYNFDFPTAERDYAVLAIQYPNHPLPEFLVALGYWWRIEVDVTNEKYDATFVKYLDRAISKAEVMFDADEENKEASCKLLCTG